MPQRIFTLLLFSLYAFSYHVCAQQPTDSTDYVNIRGEAGVTIRKNRSPLKTSADGKLRWDLTTIKRLPQILGNADPMRYLQALPSVQTSSEYDAGLHVQGCSAGQNVLMLGEGIVYNPAHLMGIFSTFNTAHFPSMDFEPTTSPAVASRLGGSMQMLLPSLSEMSRLEGDFSLGPLAAQGTMDVPLSSKAALRLSGRQAYFNLLYGHWIQTDDADDTRYGFGDYNVTLQMEPAPGHFLTLNGYYGRDRLKVVGQHDRLPSSLHWENWIGEVSWHHASQRAVWKQTLTAQGYTSHLRLHLFDSHLSLPAHIRTYRYKASADLYSRWTVGADAQWHDVLPQSPQVESPYSQLATVQSEQQAWETAAYALYHYVSPKARFELHPALRFTLFHTPDGHSRYALSPYISAIWHVAPLHSVTLKGGLQHQFLHQAGFTSLGMPTEFWFASTKQQPPQRSCSATLIYKGSTKDEAWGFTAELYWKRLYHQLEYADNVLTLLTDQYSLTEALLQGNGANYGLGLQLTRRLGPVTGWISYSWGRTLRRFSVDGVSSRYPSNYERRHEANLMLSYQPRPRLNFSLTGLVASGTPFTAPESFYLINGYVLSQYGRHNGCRLPLYWRFDAAVDYRLRSRGRVKQSLNFSLYNVFGTNNTVFYRLRFRDETFAYRPVSFLKYPLPSFSYNIKF